MIVSGHDKDISNKILSMIDIKADIGLVQINITK